MPYDRALASPRTIIEAFLPPDGTVATKIIYDTANAAGLPDQPVRLALRRMMSAGDLVLRGRGRQAVAELTTNGRQRLERDRLALQFAFAQDHGLAPWDGTWHLVALSTPETERTARDTLRRQLTQAGAAAVSTGLYLSPHDLAGILDSTEQHHVVLAHAYDVNIHGETDPRRVTEMLWPAAPVRAAYTRLDEVVDHLERNRHHDEHARPDRPADPSATALLTQLHLAEALEHAMREDPLIPAELRAAPWAPASTRERWRTAWTAASHALPNGGLYNGWLHF